MRGNNIYLRGYEKGLKVKEVIRYKPYMFIPKVGGKYRTLKDQPVEKLMFDDISESRDFSKRYEDVANMEIYGLTSYPHLFIYDTFKGEVDYDPALISIGTIDIECAADDGFPSIKLADKELTAITVRCRNRSYVFGCGSFHTTDPNIFYVQCKDEHELIMQFLDTWEMLDLDIVTGWNIEFFDIPYLVNRITRLFGDSMPKRLSPWKMIEEKIVEFRGKENQSFQISGLSVLDYYQVYRKFKFGNQESYKLDYISQVELGEKKIDYAEYGSLLELYKNNFQKFIEYNIYDCVLVDRLEDKLGFLQQIMALAYDAKVNYSETMATVKPWDIIIHNYLLDQGIVIPQFKKQDMFTALVGGYVKNPRVGLSRWVVSFDLNSLYPHLIMQYNISPEMFVGRRSMKSIDDLLLGTEKYELYTHAANGCMYRKDKQGFLPALMEKMYNDRVVYKNKMLEAKKMYEKTRSVEDSKAVARYHNMQLAKKIQLNSAYGALGNQYFRWFNFDHAEAITTSGQLSIRWIEEKINRYMNDMLKTDGKDYVIASDTDSIYVEMGPLVDKVFGSEKDERKVVKALDNFCNDRIQPYIDSCYQELADNMNAYQQKMQMKRETIANKAIWKEKKMYILNAWNVEGVQYEKPQLKISGIEAVRSSTPHVCREKIKDALSIIMNGSQDELQQFISNFRHEFSTLPFEAVAFPRGVNGLGKYRDHTNIYKKGCPIQVKGSLLFNYHIKKNNLKNIIPISDGDKIKFAYLKMPNPIHESVISSPGALPHEFDLEQYIDRNTQFEKAFIDPLRSITNVINWEIEKKANLEDFFA